MSILQTIDLKKYYGTEPNITRALDGVNFSVEDGEFVAVVGTSGSGKSTLLHMMGGLDTPTSGNVIVRDKELSKMNDEQLTIFRRRNIGFIFQNYNLVPILNVYENIVLPVELDGDTVDQKFLDEIVHLLGLEDKLKNMTLSNHQARKQEISTLRSVGLSLKQLYRSLITEGLLYVLVSFGIVLLVGIPIAIPVSKAVGILFGMPNLSYQFPTMQIGGYLLILILLQLILSVWEIRDLKKRSLTEQMRAME